VAATAALLRYLLQLVVVAAVALCLSTVCPVVPVVELQKPAPLATVRQDKEATAEHRFCLILSPVVAAEARPRLEPTAPHRAAVMVARAARIFP
jgi:hypothetical protein